MNAPPSLFSVPRRRAQLARAMDNGGEDFFGGLAAESLLDRLTMVTRRFARALLIAPQRHPLREPLATMVDQLTVAEGVGATAAGAPPYDLIIWPGGLETVNDVPGALLQARARLSADGLLTGAFVGDGSFPLLRRLLAGDGMRGVPRMHPQIDLKTFGNLLQRTGFALPVCDIEALELRYRHWRALVNDLRSGGLTSALADAPPPLRRSEIAALDRNFAEAAGDNGAATESLRLVFFTGWAPHPDQPQPARRGSGKSSLAAALKAINPPDD